MMGMDCFCCEVPRPVASHLHPLAYCQRCGADAVLVARAPNGLLVCRACVEGEA